MEVVMEFQSKNEYIDRLMKKEILVTWSFLLIGLSGVNSLSPKIKLEEVVDFCLHIFLGGSNNDYIEKIAFSGPFEQDIVVKNLQRLEKKNQIEMAHISWSLLLLEDLLSNLSLEPMQGLLELTDFWGYMGFPAYSPHIIQGIQSPEEYYSEENYIFLFNEHKNWIVETEKKLKAENIMPPKTGPLAK